MRHKKAFMVRWAVKEADQPHIETSSLYVAEIWRRALEHKALEHRREPDVRIVVHIT